MFDTNFTRASIRATDAGNQLHSAYWAQSEDYRKFHLAEAMKALKRCAELLGYELVPITPPVDPSPSEIQPVGVL